MTGQDPNARPPAPDILKPAPDFSLVLGGPLYQLLLKSRMLRPPLNLLRRRIVAISAIAWLPLLVLSVVGGQALGGSLRIPFLHDIEAHARFLLALPALIYAEMLVHQRIRVVVQQFIHTGIVLPEDRLKFDDAIASAMRLRNSVVLEVALIVLVFTLGQWVWHTQIALGTSTWYANADGNGQGLTIAGRWYAFVSIPLFQFILLRWYTRLFIWFRFLWQVSRLNLRLIATHPDRAGGLGFLGSSAYAFSPILFAQGALLAGFIANRIFFDGQTLLAFKVDIAGLVILLVLVILGPLSMFMPTMASAKRQGRRDYGLLANRYAREFDAKWNASPGERSATGEPLLGSADIQSLADLGNSYSVVREMRILPFGMDSVAQLALATLAPILPLVLTIVPLEEMVDKLVNLVF